MTDYRFAPCPFCGAGTTELRESRLSPSMSGPGALISASVHHWCKQSPGVIQNTIKFTGREIADAVDAWNRRSAD